MSGDLFQPPGGVEPWPESLGQGTTLIHGLAMADAPALWAEIGRITALAPFRHMLTPGGQGMSVAMSNCGALGWVTDRKGYRYAALDPASGKPWPPMPPLFRALAQDAAAQGGFPGFEPDACLINRYGPGARMSLHQDRDEVDLAAPIVSVSLGLPAVFLFGGMQRTDKSSRLSLVHGDVLVWGGVDRLRFHGVLPVAEGSHPLTGACRINLTFRKAA